LKIINRRFLLFLQAAKHAIGLIIEQLCLPSQGLVHLASAQEMLDLCDAVILPPFVRAFL